MGLCRVNRGKQNKGKQAGKQGQTPIMTQIDIRSRLRELGHLVGNTPLMAIDCAYKGEPRRIYAKAENFNLFGINIAASLFFSSRYWAKQ